MKSNRKKFLLVSGAFVLCLGLPNLAPAINNFAEELEEQQIKQPRRSPWSCRERGRSGEGHHYHSWRSLAGRTR